MTTLVLVRHGLTHENHEQRYLGHSDPPLSPIGQRQASWLAQRLGGESFHAVYSSDLLRASSTAERAALAVKRTVYRDERLREMNFGCFEGLTYEEVQTHHPQMAAGWFSDAENPPAGGERLSDMAARVHDVLSDILHRHREQRVLIVAHKGSLQMLLCCLLNLPAYEHWRFEVKPCALTQIDVYEAGGILMRLNDDAHLMDKHPR